MRNNSSYIDMAAGKLSPQDRKDLDKFTKFLIYKSVQIVVQSRLGLKVKTLSKPYSTGSDWFNLAIRDIPEVTAETKKALASQLISTTRSLCVEISLKTAEGDTMVLETWSLSMTDQCDTSVKVSYMVYNRMGVLLKSLFCVSRVTPGYRLSRTQGPDNYVICYRIYTGEPNVNHLGVDHKTSRVGLVPTPIGTIVLSVSYRTKMLISPHQSTRDLGSDIKDDHFKQDSPKKTAPKPCQFTYHNNSNRSSCGDEIMPASSVDSGDICTQYFPPSSSPDAVFNKNFIHREDSKENGYTDRSKSFTDNHKAGAFAPSSDNENGGDPEDIPFAGLYINGHGGDISPSKKSVGSRKSDGSDLDVPGYIENGSNSSSDTAPPEDFVMKTPFAAADPSSDLGKFYRECQGAPGLTMFENSPTVAESLDQIDDQINSFESNINDFDDFVHGLQTNGED